MSTKPMRWKKASGPSSPGSQSTVMRSKPRRLASSASAGREEAADALALHLGVDVDAPDAGPELLVRVLGVEVAVDEPDDVVAHERDALPRRVGVHDRCLGGVGDRSDELLLAGLQREGVRRDDVRRRQFFKSQLSHAAKANLWRAGAGSRAGTYTRCRLRRRVCTAGWAAGGFVSMSRYSARRGKLADGVSAARDFPIPLERPKERSSCPRSRLKARSSSSTATR